jgi:quercetin dioxygenase-like cupin family protein
MAEKRMMAIDTQALPWEERFNEKLGRALYRKNLVTDPDTGMEVRLVRYPAGVVNVRHTHPCAHGMYVLEGTLVTKYDDRYQWPLLLCILLLVVEFFVPEKKKPAQGVNRA